MSEPLDELYFKWLYGQVGDPSLKNPRRSYWRLLRHLFEKEFVWIVANDDNRIEDGKDLRFEFIDASGLEDVDLGWVNLGCSMFELLLGLSRRLAFEAGGGPRGWFWEMLDNLGLSQINYNDRAEFSGDEVNDILDRVIWRTYGSDGQGGLFPQKNTTRDQRDVELWYQLSEYVMDRI